MKRLKAINTEFTVLDVRPMPKRADALRPRVSWMAPHLYMELRAYERAEARRRALEAAITVLALVALTVVLVEICGGVQ